MPIALHKDRIVSGGHVLKLPRWICPSSHNLGRYWHIPRSASFDPHKERRRKTHHDRKVELSVQTWCGQLRFCAWHDFTDTEPETMQCGTCVGRAEGYNAERLIFKPADHFKPPTYCPGRSVGRSPLCFVCGETTRWYRDGEAKHRPILEELQRWSPCPRHGWRDMRARSSLGQEWRSPCDILICTTFRCEHVTNGH